MPKISAVLSEKAYDGWRLFARSRGVSISALLEALGHVLDDLDQPDGRLPTLVRDAVSQARQIDDDRRRRS